MELNCRDWFIPKGKRSRANKGKKPGTSGTKLKVINDSGRKEERRKGKSILKIVKSEDDL